MIPARGGSKGILGKNLRGLDGKPLVAHSIEAALAAARVTRVVVSTDEDRIAAIAREYGADVVMRPAAISGDTASSEAAVLHTLDALEAGGYKPELTMLIQCTSPLTTPEDLDGAVERLCAAEADSCFTAVPFHHFLWRTNADGTAVGINHSGVRRKRRQDLEPQWLENGAAYVMRTAAFRKAGDRFCGVVVAHVVDESRCLEIDVPVDLGKAAAVMAYRRASREATDLPCPDRCGCVRLRWRIHRRASAGVRRRPRGGAV